MEDVKIPEGEELQEANKKAYRVYQDNIRAVDPMVYELTKGARSGVSEKELLKIALEALEKCKVE